MNPAVEKVLLDALMEEDTRLMKADLEYRQALAYLAIHRMIGLRLRQAIKLLF